MIEKECIDAWAQSTHLSFLHTDGQQENRERSDDDQDEINFISNGLDEISCSHYVFSYIQSHTTIALCTRSHRAQRIEPNYTIVWSQEYSQVSVWEKTLLW